MGTHIQQSDTLNGNGSPLNRVPSRYIGQIYFDSVGGGFYISQAPLSSGWVPLTQMDIKINIGSGEIMTVDKYSNTINMKAERNILISVDDATDTVTFLGPDLSLYQTTDEANEASKGFISKLNIIDQNMNFIDKDGNIFGSLDLTRYSNNFVSSVIVREGTGIVDLLNVSGEVIGSIIQGSDEDLDVKYAKLEHKHKPNEIETDSGHMWLTESDKYRWDNMANQLISVKYRIKSIVIDDTSWAVDPGTSMMATTVNHNMDSDMCIFQLINNATGEEMLCGKKKINMDSTKLTLYEGTVPSICTLNILNLKGISENETKGIPLTDNEEIEPINDDFINGLFE